MTLRGMTGAMTLEHCSGCLDSGWMNAAGLLDSDVEATREAARNTDRIILAQSTKLIDERQSWVRKGYSQWSLE
jgi:hypothetical protein